MADTQPIVEQVDATELKSPPDENAATAAAESDDEQPKAKRSKKNATVKTREMRLEQNRKAARESRKRKKVLVEELQRSVIFFSRANGTLRGQNEEMEQMLIQAQAQLQVIEGAKPNLAPAVSTSPWAMMPQGFPQGAPLQVAVPQQQDAVPPAQGLASSGEQQQPQQGYDNQALANWMNLAAMGGMPYMGGMMPFGFPYMGQAPPQTGPVVHNPLTGSNLPHPQHAANGEANV